MKPISDLFRKLLTRATGLDALQKRFDTLQNKLDTLLISQDHLQSTVDSIKEKTDCAATETHIGTRFDTLQNKLDTFLISLDHLHNRVHSIKENTDCSVTKDTLGEAIENLGHRPADEKLNATEIGLFIETQRHYEIVLDGIRGKANSGRPVTVGFFILYDSAFPAKPLFERLRKEDTFRPVIIIIPDIMRGMENMLYQQKKSYDFYSSQYSDVLVGYNEETGEYIDYSDDLDFVFFSNPYDYLTHEYYTVDYLRQKSVLPIFIHYGFALTKYTRGAYRLNSYGYSWRVFTNTYLNLRELEEYALGNGRNAVVTGYCKMDGLAEQEIVPRERKTIIIAPHHTVREWKDGLELSNFLSYADFFLRLPEMYRNVDFVFRPHPLLFVSLRMEDMWGAQRVDEYLNRLLTNENVRYSDEADYFPVFANSDAIIHDCGSFVAEYLFTDHPACFLLTDDEVIVKNFAPIGKECLDFHYKAYCESDILSFIDDVVLAGNDAMLEARKAFSASALKYNYPKASDKILEYLKEAIGKGS